jgi:methylated-DNA-[protein]-cysteine S-methyltransferase
VTETIQYEFIDTPLGRTMVAWSEEGVVSIRFGSTLQESSPDPGWRRGSAPENEAARQLRAYFGGELRVFDLAVDARGTPFQKEVWDSLRCIPYGETRSYADVARSIGRPRAVRAVGAANGRNDVPIVVPCHRVIGSGGELRGYAGGVDIKAALLAFEKNGVWPGRLARPMSLW